VNPPHQPPVHFSRALCDRLRAEAAAQPTREVCGLIGAREGVALTHYPIANIAPDAGRRYRMDPAAQIAAFRAIRLRGEALAGIYHSHPEGPPIPSPRDLREWSYPEALCLIVELVGGRSVLRAWRWSPDGFIPVQIRPRIHRPKNAEVVGKLRNNLESSPSRQESLYFLSMKSARSK
jgi:proteasome lid subunit RPN8/RPN11